MTIGSFEITINKGNTPLRITVGCDKATDEKQFIAVHLACPKCNNRIRQKNVCVTPSCENNGKEIIWGEANKLVCLDEKNAELQRAFTSDEYKSIFEKSKTARIEIIGITPLSAINRIGIMASYYLTPKSEKKDKAKTQENNYFYSMLKEAMTNQYALIGKVMLRSKENLCVIYDFGEALLLQTMYYNDEIREIKTFENTALNSQDKLMAKEWIKQIVNSEAFDVSLLKNEDKQIIINKCFDLISNKDIPVLENPIEERKPFVNNPFAMTKPQTQTQLKEQEKEKEVLAK